MGNLAAAPGAKRGGIKRDVVEESLPGTGWAEWVAGHPSSLASIFVLRQELLTLATRF